MTAKEVGNRREQVAEYQWGKRQEIDRKKGRVLAGKRQEIDRQKGIILSRKKEAGNRQKRRQSILAKALINRQGSRKTISGKRVTKLIGKRAEFWRVKRLEIDRKKGKILVGKEAQNQHLQCTPSSIFQNIQALPK